MRARCQLCFTRSGLALKAYLDRSVVGERGGLKEKNFIYEFVSYLGSLTGFLAAQ